jgi:hypothetical protein
VHGCYAEGDELETAIRRLSVDPGFSAFVLEDGVVYQTYRTRWRGVEFLMSY